MSLMPGLSALFHGKWPERCLFQRIADVFPVSIFVGCLLCFGGATFAQVPNTQEETIPLSSPEQALASVQAPEGFEVSLFAAEPDVRQPIGMAFDTRGRLWVAECYTYAENGDYDLDLDDRILIFEDTDDDGRADRRKVFWEGGRRLTSIEIGFGGVWALCTPELLFIPDRDGDDRPDSEPIVVLDGWVSAGHTLVNGLRWGPDGWLYGRHGIQGTSRVGPPGASSEDRVPINCGIWRYHPQRKKFEVVCHGTTNPWGMDWNDRGQLFFINTVIGHLWHVLPGAHYRRMYGEDLRPHLYEPIQQTADHVHWDAGNEDWTAQRQGVSEGTSRAGGGHAHTGLMFYLGGNWPGKYRDELFTLNLHGRRINHDHVERAGATYAGRHRPDLLRWGDQWFRGLDLAYGRDGGVYVLDWSDIGECHEADGVYRTSGRIYKITWRGDHGREKRTEISELRPSDVAKLTHRELVQLQQHRNEWFVRQARRVLQERAVRGDDLSEARHALWEMFHRQSEVPRKLRALWSLHVTGGIETDRLIGLLEHENEHLRVWAIQLLVDDGRIEPEVRAALETRAKADDSGLVLAYLASALQRMPEAERFEMAESIAVRSEFGGDRVLPLMVWYGVESAVVDHMEESLDLIKQSRMPRVSRYIARRLTGEIDHRPEGVAGLMEILRDTEESMIRRQVLTGMAEAVRGWGQATAPQGWAKFASDLQQDSSDEELLSLVRELSIVFGEGLEFNEIIGFVLDREQPTETRRQAIRSLAAADAAGLSAVLKRLLDDPAVVEEAVRGLASIDLKQFAPLLLEAYGRIDGRGKDAVVEVLASRADTAEMLLDAVVEREMVPRTEVDAYVLRQMQALGDVQLSRRIAGIWPDQQLIGEDKITKISRYRDQLTPDVLASADPARGRKLFDQTCGQCHKLFGEGGTIGPELTGGQRGELGYWLENLLAPSAVIPDEYRMSLVELKDGRLLSGLVEEKTDRTVTLQTPTERMILQRSAIERIRSSEVSMMPEGQIEAMNDRAVRDLIAYLMSPQQVKVNDVSSSQ